MYISRKHIHIIALAAALESLAAVVMITENSVEETFSKYLADKFPNAAKCGTSGVYFSVYSNIGALTNTTSSIQIVDETKVLLNHC